MAASTAAGSAATHQRQGSAPYNHARPPSPGDDASPFLLRIYVTHGNHFRPLRDFEHHHRPLRDEFKVYVWRSTPLRTLVQLLHSSDPSISDPLTPHSFRLVYYNSRRDVYACRDMGRGITRISRTALSDKLSSDGARAMVGRGRDNQDDDADDAVVDDGAKTLGECDLVDGDFVECLVPLPVGRGGGGGRSARSAAAGAIMARQQGPGGWGPPPPVRRSAADHNSAWA